MKTKEIYLNSRPVGWPDLSNFAFRNVEVAELDDEFVLVKVLWLSVDPYMRGRMNQQRQYVAPFEIGGAISGGGIGQVVSSRSSGFLPGDFVLGTFRWREFDSVSSPGLRKLDPDLAPLTAHLGVLGMPGLTAFVGLRKIGGLKPSDTVFVSAAAGAVGSVAGQIAKISGANVIGSAGSDQKVESVLNKGFDAAFNYKKTSVRKALVELAPEGITLYFDNVGGDHLEGALANMANFGRVVMCGAISQYNLDVTPTGPSNLGLVVTRRLRLQGFIVSDHATELGPFLSEATGWIRHGKLHYDETVRDGLDAAPEAFLSLLRGDNLGKMLVKVSDPN